MPLALAVERMIFGKSLNAGQICVAPDYVLLPRGQEQAFIEAYQAHFRRLYPKGLESPDYGAIINAQMCIRDRALAHLQHQGRRGRHQLAAGLAPGEQARQKMQGLSQDLAAQGAGQQGGVEKAQHEPELTGVSLHPAHGLVPVVAGLLLERQGGIGLGDGGAKAQLDVLVEALDQHLLDVYKRQAGAPLGLDSGRRWLGL